MLLAVVGGAAGLGLAVLGTKWLSTVVASSLPFTTTISVDGPVLLFALAVSMTSGVLFGVAPAWRASRTDVQDMLRTRTGGAGVGHVATRNGLVVVQLALSLALLTCAGLLTRTLLELQRVPTGFDTKNLMTMQFRLPTTKYDTPAKIWAMFEQTIAEIRTVPGVESAALVRAFPLTGNGESYPVTIDGRPAEEPGSAPNMQLNTVTPGYFATMRIPRLGGRDIDAGDRADAVPAIVVNAEFARRTWPNESAIGKRVKLGGDERWWTIVGVVGSTKHFALNEAQLLQGYIPHAQRPQIFTTVAARTTGDPLTLARSIREAVWRVDRDQPVWSVRTMDQLLSGAVGSNKLIMMLTAGFAVIALLLAAVGIYGVLSYTMAQRTHEVGIRMALGAQAGQVRRMVVVDGMRVVALAVVVGLALSFAATRLLRTQLFGVGPGDPLTFAIVTGILTVVALVACYIPARRASRIDPLVALRTD
jgi:putative ABC transport system permease protein